ncbi:MAG: ABC transporter ATP-binding protein [Oscillospiraceae bacterium]|nr:ABC transporter ATP-binding protein [Oscillospiraceae bacterium]
MVLEYDSGCIAARLEHSRKILVNHVTFSLEEGETLALIGETGSGKTMTAMSILHLLPYNVKMEGGRVLFLGQELTERKDIQPLLGVDMVYIPQNGLEFLNPSRTVRLHLYDSLKKLGIRGKTLEKAALEKLSAVGFEAPEQVIGKYPFQLSGGMAQRVTIAIAACSRAKLLIADEPTNGLDYAAKVRFLEMLTFLFPDAAKLVITHDITVAQLCRNTLVLCGGRMMEKGPSPKILTEPKHPYTKALIGALVENGMKETAILRQQAGDCPFFRRCPEAAETCCLARHCAGDTEWWCSHP